MAVVLVVAAAVLVGVVVAVGLLVLAAWFVRGRLSGWATRQLVDVAGPAVIRSLQPRVALSALLSRVFGEAVGHDEIATALLGGGGHDVLSRDVAVSWGTTVHISLKRINEMSCLTEITWSHEFPGVRDNHRLVMFATSSADIFAALTARRVYPLFESWLVPTEDQLEEFAPGFKVGIAYRDENGFVHTVSPQAAEGLEVALRDYDQYVQLPDRLDRHELRIFLLDLYDLAHPDHVVEAIERLTLRGSTIGPFEQGFVNWSAPFPCFVDTIVFDVENLPRAHEKLVFQVLVYAISTHEIPFRTGWTHVPDQIEVAVRAWMLPGHGVTLLWRPVDGMESLYGVE